MCMGLNSHYYVEVVKTVSFDTISSLIGMYYMILI